MISEDLRKSLLYVKGKIISGNGLRIDSLIDRIIVTGNVNVVSDTGHNLLHFYAMQNGKEVTLLVSRKLLENKIDVNAKTENGRTPLINATIFNNVEMVKLLLEFGANVNLKDNSLRSAIDFTSNDEIIGLLKGFRTNVISEKLMEVLEEFVNSLGDKKISQFINDIVNSGNINFQDKLGNTILHYFVSIYPDGLDLIKLFLEDGVNPKIENNNGFSVYDIAKPHYYITKLLDEYIDKEEEDVTDFELLKKALSL